MNEREADIRAGFAHLRNLCDERGHDLLRVMEDLLLVEAERGDLAVRRVLAVEPDGGYVIACVRAWSG